MKSSNTVGHSVLNKLFLESAGDLLSVNGIMAGVSSVNAGNALRGGSGTSRRAGTALAISAIDGPSTARLPRFEGTDGRTDIHSTTNYVSVLGAAGEGVALSSMLTFDRPLLVSMHPLGGGEITQADLEDWCRELNNQLVGRVKNRLLNYGITVTLGLPVFLQGTGVRAVATPDLTLSQYTVQTSSGNISLALSTLLAEDLQFVEQEGPNEEVLLEGAVSLF